MKETQLIQMKNKIDALTRIVKHLLQEVNNNATLAKGLLGLLVIGGFRIGLTLHLTLN